MGRQDRPGFRPTGRALPDQRQGISERRCRCGVGRDWASPSWSRGSRTVGSASQGVIHLTRQAAQIAGSMGAIRMDSDGVLRTRLGTPVVAGVGYDPEVVRAAPAKAPIAAPKALGPRPDNQWGYATGPVVVHLGPSEFIGEHLDIEDERATDRGGTHRCGLLGFVLRQRSANGYDPIGRGRQQCLRTTPQASRGSPSE